MYKCEKCNKTIPDNQVEENVVKAGPSDNPKLYCKECGDPVTYIPDPPKKEVGMQGAQATLNSNSDNRVINGDNSGNTTTINIHNNDAANIDKLSEAFGRVQEQTADTIIKYMKEAASLGNREEKLLTEDWGEIDKSNARTCNSCHNLVPSQHYDHQQHLCVNCLYKKAERLKDNDLWDEAIDEFKRVEMISTAEMLSEVQEAIGICYYMDDDKKKAKKYLALAETPWSYYVLGYCFLGEDVDQAIKNFTKAAEKDVVPAQIWLKDYYLDGKNKQFEKAEPWLLKLAKSGNLLSQFQLANVYMIYANKNKNHAQEYYKKAAGWLEKVAAENIDIAKYQLGDLLLRGDGLDKDTERAIELMTQAGENGFLACQFDLATIYEKGKYGISADQEKALYWYKKVAEHNPNQDVVVIAMKQIGHFYLDGKGGVGRNYQEAANWLKKAATRGNIPAQVSLGKLYKDKMSNWDEAINWLTKASSNGNIEAKYELGCLYLLQSATKPERRADADSLLVTAANGGHVGAMMKMAQCYEEKGLFNSAQDFYQKAADKGSQEAQQILDERFSGKTFAEKWRKFVNSPIWNGIGSLLSKMKGCIPFIIVALIILFAVNMCNRACQSCTGSHDSSSAVSNQTIYTETEVDEPAHYPTGNKQLNKDIKSLMKNQYISGGGERFLSGELHLHFIITKEGRAVVDTKSIPIENKDVVRALVEVMNHLPKQWQPAKKGSEYVNQYVDVELEF